MRGIQDGNYGSDKDQQLLSTNLKGLLMIVKINQKMD